jgi:hypothetical protein
VERICAKDGITRELVQEIEKVIFQNLDPTDTLNASDFQELRAIKTESIRAEGERLKAEIQSIIHEECGLRDTIAKVPDKRTRLKTLQIEREGLEKQMPPAISLEDAELQLNLQNKRQSLVNVQQLAANEKQNIQRVDDIRTRVVAFKAQMVRFYDEILPLLQNIGVPETQLDAFRPTFSGDVELPLNHRTDAINAKLAELDGGNPPLDGTIKKLLSEIETLTKSENADKARQERTKQIQTRIAAINSESERLKAEIENVENVGKPRVVSLASKRLDTYVAYFTNLGVEQAALQGLYEPIRYRLSEQAMLDGNDLEFAIRWAANIDSWLNRGSDLFDQRRPIPFGNFENLGREVRKVLLPAWSSGNPAKIQPAFTNFKDEFNKEELKWQNYVRSGVTLEHILTWLYDVGHISLDYGLKFKGADLESLSPGTKGIVLLILFLRMDVNDTRPLIVDQPDENLDNESIYKLLTPYFRNAKIRRQIVVITHNPNLVVNSDSEQVVIASSEKRQSGLPAIRYVSGAMENNQPAQTGIRQQVCNILEGGDVAFLKRERRYAIEKRPKELS